MKKQDIIGILITFAIGFVGGAYLYLTYWAVVFNPDAASVSDIGEFSIVSESYGACGSTCPSFQVIANGQYRFLHEARDGSSMTISEGSLPRSVLRDVERAVDERELLSQSRKINPQTCRSYDDGIDVRYAVSVDGVTYDLDSCGTAIDRDSALWIGLAEIWNYLQTENL